MYSMATWLTTNITDCWYELEHVSAPVWTPPCYILAAQRRFKLFLIYRSTLTLTGPESSLFVQIVLYNLASDQSLLRHLSVII